MKPTEAQRVDGPFSGLLVIDLTHVLNGPFGTTILSDLGARVIKVEPPGHGDDTRTYGPFYKDQSLYFSFINRGKESIVLNLKEERDRSLFRNMIRRRGAKTHEYQCSRTARRARRYTLRHRHHTTAFCRI